MIMTASRAGLFPSHFVLLIALATGVLAQNYTTPQECASRANTVHYGVYDAIRSLGTTDSMRWCPYWALECAYVYQHCPGVVTCNFNNTDPGCPSTYDPSVYGNSRSFLGCNRCNVEVNPISAFPSIVLVPRITATTDDTYPSSSASTRGRSGDQTAQQRGIYTATFAFTAAIVVSAFLGASVYAQRARSGRGEYAIPSSYPGAAIPSAPVRNDNNNKLMAVGTSLAFVTPLTLLLQFQAISTSGFLSIGYAPLYQYFTLNFSWANLIIPLQAFKDAANKLDATRVCVRAVPSDTPADQDFLGLGFVARQYTGDKGNLGALAFLSGLALMVIVLLLSFLASVVLFVLTKVTKAERAQNMFETFPAIASNFILRLFVWLLGSITTFTFYQFSQPCSSRSLLALAGFQFTFLLAIFLIISVLVVRTVKREGNPEVLYKSDESGETTYSRRWSSLYDNFKPAFYYWFILENLATLVRAAVVSFVQGAGFRQLGALVGLDFLSFAALAFVRPYDGVLHNTYEAVSAGKRLFMTAMMYVYWQGFNVEAANKRRVGTAQITVETLHAAALITILLMIGGIGAVRGLSKQRTMKA